MKTNIQLAAECIVYHDPIDENEDAKPQVNVGSVVMRIASALVTKDDLRAQSEVALIEKLVILAKQLKAARAELIVKRRHTLGWILPPSEQALDDATDAAGVFKDAPAAEGGGA